MNTRCTTPYNHAYTPAFSRNRASKELIEARGVPGDTREYDAVKPTCAERAAWAERAVHAYARAKEGRAYDPVTDIAPDLMADLCHLLVREGVLPDLALERARNHCQDECAEEGIVI